MSSGKHFRKYVAAIALCGTLNPWVQLPAASPKSKPTSTRVPDVQLDAQGTFRGVVVDGQGQPVALTRLSIVRAETRGATATAREVTTNERGQFEFQNVAAGTYRIQTTAGVYLCRLWTHQAAPPSAAPSLLVVNDVGVARGQRPIHEVFHSDPILMATVVAAAIAIPIAIHKSRDDAPEGS